MANANRTPKPRIESAAPPNVIVEFLDEHDARDHCANVCIEGIQTAMHLIEAGDHLQNSGPSMALSVLQLVRDLLIADVDSN